MEYFPIRAINPDLHQKMLSKSAKLALHISAKALSNVVNLYAAGTISRNAPWNCNDYNLLLFKHLRTIFKERLRIFYRLAHGMH